MTLPSAPMETSPVEPSIYLAVPHYGQIEPAALPGLMLPTRHRIHVNTNGCSLLAHNFNRLFCDAANLRASRGLTHFAMLHADVEAPPYWIDALIEEMDRVRADVLSVVLPIKDGRGLTTTGVQHPETQRITRLTVRETLALPQTFDAGTAGYPGYHLMINTGCWVARFDGDWVERFPGFAILDGIVRGDDGRLAPRVLSEDWNFSGWAARHGLRVLATRRVPCKHHGRAAYVNDTEWGEWDTDKGDPQ